MPKIDRVSPYVKRRLSQAKIKISPQARSVLTDICRVRPDVGKIVLKTIVAKDWQSLGLDRLRAPKTILSPFLAPVLRDIQSHILDCVKGSNLSLDALEQFIPHPKNISAELPFKVNFGRRPVSMTELEYSNTKVIRLLRKTHLRLLTLAEIRDGAKIAGNKEVVDAAEYDIDALIFPLLMARDEIKEDEGGYRQIVRRRIVSALQFMQLRNLFGSNSSNASILSAHELLCRENDLLEADRLRKPVRTEGEKPPSSLADKVKKMSLRSYDVRILPDGTWIIPQKGYRAMGKEHWKDEIRHKVSEDSVVRRNQHIIESCSAELAQNIHNLRLLLNVKNMLEIQKGEAARPEIRGYLVSLITEAARSYSRAIIRDKEDVYDRLEEAAFQILNGVPKLPLAMVKRAIELLNARNEDLSSMINNLLAKGGIELSEIEFMLRRDEQIRILTHNILNALTNRQNLLNPKWVEGIAKRIENFMGLYLSKVPRREHGIRRITPKFIEAVEQLKRTARKVEERKRLDEIKRARQNKEANDNEKAALENQITELQKRLERIFISADEAEAEILVRLNSVEIMLRGQESRSNIVLVLKAIETAKKKPWRSSISGLMMRLSGLENLLNREIMLEDLRIAVDAAEQRHNLVRISSGQFSEWYTRQIEEKGRLQREMDRLQERHTWLQKQGKLAKEEEGRSIEDIDREMDELAREIAGELMEVSDAVYSVNLDVELKHVSMPNINTITRRIEEENRPIRNRISSLIEQE